MPTLRPKNSMAKDMVHDTLRGQKFTLSPASKVYTDNSPYIDFTYTEEENPARFMEPAYKATFEDGTYLYLDQDEVIL